jgi:regulator of sigma E protease
MDFSTLVLLPFNFLAANALPFLVALMVIVFVHEFGHFIVARWCGVKVEAFSIGFGREIFGWNDSHGTRWKLAWIPLGGYVRFEGDANAASVPEDSSGRAPRSAGNFHGKSLWQRAAVVAAGPFANFLLAIAIFAAGFMVVGEQVVKPQVGEILAGSPAEQAGLKSGDLILKIDGESISNFIDIPKFALLRGGETVSVLLDRQGQEITLPVTLRTVEEDDGAGGKVRHGQFGFKAMVGPDSVQLVRHGLVSSLGQGVEETWYIIATTLKYVGKLFTGSESTDRLGGVGKIANGASAAASVGPIAFFYFIAFLSVSIGLINLFPVPMLDGGHLVFYAIEAVIGKPLGPNAQEWGFRIGLTLILIMMAVGNLNDVISYMN